MAPNLRSTLLALAAAALLGACQTTGPSKFSVGPDIDEGTPAAYEGVRLDVAIPVFDPGLPEDADELIEENIWPELRRTEANRFAVTLKETLAKTNVFGDVRVTPDAKGTADLYVMGVIEESNGEDIAIQIQVIDISGKQWMDREYDLRVKEGFWRDKQNENKDPYQPVFDEAAEDIAELVRRGDSEDLTTLRNLTEMRFGNTFSPETFGDHLEKRGNRVALKSLPAQNDPMYLRTKAIKVQEGLFMDQMQESYSSFYQRTNDSYLVWQKAAMPSAKAQREAETGAIVSGVLGVLSAVVGAAAVTASVDNADSGAAAAQYVGGLAGVLVGANLLEKASESSREAEYHAGRLSELSSTIDLEMSPQVVELGAETIELTGTAREQFREWRALLKRIYATEEVPAIQLSGDQS